MSIRACACVCGGGRAGVCITTTTNNNPPGVRGYNIYCIFKVCFSFALLLEFDVGVRF